MPQSVYAAFFNLPRSAYWKAVSFTFMNNAAVQQLAFAIVAGASVLVTLVIGYRRRRAARAVLTHDQTRILDERFTETAAQLRDGQAAVRLAGVHALADLADDWLENRQTCIDALCAYLRTPYEPDPGEADTAEQLEYHGRREVRHAAILVIAEHLREGAVVPWRGMNFDFTGVIFDGGDFSGAIFSSGTADFSRAEFTVGTVRFNLAEFSGAAVGFRQAKFSGGAVYFGGAVFSGGTVRFDGAEFSGGSVRFDYAEFSGGEVSFGQARFSGSAVGFDGARFAGGTVNFSDAGDWSDPPTFDWTGTPPPGVALPGADDTTPP
jgi:uncharacterized protein YjbI with pentapeptide repeats